MADTTGDAFYRSFIDRLVAKCRDDFFEVKVRSGVWNRNATADFVPEDHSVNQLLEALSPQQREVLGRLLTRTHEEGVFNVLVALHEEGVEPFDRGYAGDPYHDFIGRMDDWEWPEGDERWV